MNMCLYLKILIILLIMLTADNTVLLPMDVNTRHSKILKPQVIDFYEVCSKNTYRAISGSQGSDYLLPSEM